MLRVIRRQPSLPVEASFFSECNPHRAIEKKCGLFGDDKKNLINVYYSIRGSNIWIGNRMSEEDAAAVARAAHARNVLNLLALGRLQDLVLVIER